MKMIDVLAFAMKEWPESTSIFIFGDETCTRDQWEAAVKARNSKNKEWNGEGLPPAGTVCEHKVFRCDSWSKATVIAYGEKKTFYRDEHGHEWARISDEIEFRKIRTPEEIEQEERRRGISEISKILHSGASTLEEDAATLWDLGWRKQEPK